MSNNFFSEISIEPYGNCFYCCISYYLYKTQKNHLEIREAIFKYIKENAEEFYTFFEGNDIEELNKLSPDLLLEKYIKDNNKEGEYAGDIEYTAACKLLDLRIILFTKGYSGLNVFNIYTPESNKNNTYSNMYILFKNENHYNYLQSILDEDLSSEEIEKTINSSIRNNLLEWEKIRKKEYPLSLKWYPEIYREMYNFYKYNIIPEERFQNTSNPSVYTIRFKELAFKCFYLQNNRLYFIKINNTIRLSDGNFEDINKVTLKQIPYIYMKLFLNYMKCIITTDIYHIKLWQKNLTKAIII